MADGPARKVRDYLPTFEPAELLIYAILGAAALLMAFAGSGLYAQTGSLKDAPAGFRKVKLPSGQSSDDYLPPSLREGRYLSAPPLPEAKPEGYRNIREEEPEPDEIAELRFERRILLLKCASYYFIAARVYFDEAPEYRSLGKAALREAEALRRTRQEQESIFFGIYEEYTQSLETGVGLYDRYHETCNSVVRPLLQSKKE